MRSTSIIRLGLAALATLFVAHAGPPLICHPYNIGPAKSLPWGSGQGWDTRDTSYNLANLAADTLAILDSNAPVLVRMETLRRAAIYGSDDHAAARALLAKLAERGKSANATASSLFDYGYMASTLQQINWLYKEDLAGGVDGYQYVQNALAIDPNSAEMHFAAAIIASYPLRAADRDSHLAKARAASKDALLAQNVANHFR